MDKTDSDSVSRSASRAGVKFKTNPRPEVAEIESRWSLKGSRLSTNERKAESPLNASHGQAIT